MDKRQVKYEALMHVAGIAQGNLNTLENFESFSVDEMEQIKTEIQSTINSLFSRAAKYNDIED
jgi:hypothetical protein